MMFCIRCATGVSLLLIAAACSGADARTGSSAVAKSPLRTTFDSVALSRAFARASELPRLRSLVIQWKDSTVGEKYYGNAGATRRTNIKSASKSIISALTGIAIAQGKIRNVDQTIGELLPAETRGLDSVKRSITVRQLLSMRSGLQPTSFGNYGAWVTSSNWVRNALGRPLVAEPGGRMLYSTGSTHLLSAIITRSSGASTYHFAEQNLSRPLGIDLRPWRRDPQGVFFGGNDMYLTPQEMLRFGNLYLHRGRLDGKQIIPENWIDSSLVARTVSPFNGNSYGYGWWKRSAHGHDIHYAWGYGGQFIFIVPTLELLVVMTSDAEATRDGGHNRELHRILEEELIPAVMNR